MIKLNRGWEALPQFSKDMYKERYFLESEDYTQWLDRMSLFTNNKAMADRIKAYISNFWFHPSTPISSNGNAPKRGLPISCYVNKVGDSKESIFDTYTENNWLGSLGGGIGTDWSSVRGIGEQVGANGKSSGIIPFIQVSDRATLAVSQGGLRRASQAVYLDISHPEIEEFIDIRRPTGDTNRRALNVHHGITIPDSFMEAVEARDTWDLVSPKTGKVLKTIDAFDLWKKILVNRMETGEPYLLFKDTVNRLAPASYKTKGFEVSQSNLCSEITLHTAPDYTGICCLGSINLEYFDEFKSMLNQFIYDVQIFLDNVLQSFIDLTENKPGLEKARKSAIYERSLGLGVMGFHSYLQKHNVPWESALARSVNNNIFKMLNSTIQEEQTKITQEFGQCPLSKDVIFGNHNTHVTSIAPTASISTLCNLTSQGVDPRLANGYIQKTNIGTYEIKNKYIDVIIKDRVTSEEEYNAIWKSIFKEEGSVQHLDILTKDEKDVFKTAIELNQVYTIDMASDRAPLIDQAQSINLFIPADEQVENVYNIHMRAWKQGLKSLYYCRSTAAVRANAAGTNRKIIAIDECLSCQ